MSISKLDNIQKSVVEIIMYEPDRYLPANADLSALLKTTKAKVYKEYEGIEVVKKDVVTSFYDKVKADQAVIKGKGKKLKSYSDTVDELVQAEKKVADAVKARDQISANKNALEAILTEKACGVLDMATKIVRKEISDRELEGSQSPTEGAKQRGGGIMSIVSNAATAVGSMLEIASKNQKTDGSA